MTISNDNSNHPAPNQSHAQRLWHWTLVCVVFAITGSMSLKVSALLLKTILGLEGSFWGGPWSYRLAYLLLITPAYSVLLAIFGTLLGKRDFFMPRVRRMWRRLLPKFIANRLFGDPNSPSI